MKEDNAAHYTMNTKAPPGSYSKVATLSLFDQEKEWGDTDLYSSVKIRWAR